ncbi:MAG: hypothetical protein ABIG92_02655 [Candidatus Omnitrophota bacterium]
MSISRKDLSAKVVRFVVLGIFIFSNIAYADLIESHLRPEMGKENLKEAAAQVILRDTKKPDAGHTEAVLGAWNAAMKGRYDEAYSLVFEGLLGEDAVVNIDTAIGILNALMVYYGINTDNGLELEEVVSVVEKHKGSKDQTLMKDELRALIGVYPSEDGVINMFKQRLKEKGTHIIYGDEYRTGRYDDGWYYQPEIKDFIDEKSIIGASKKAFEILKEYEDFEFQITKIPQVEYYKEKVGEDEYHLGGSSPLPNPIIDICQDVYKLKERGEITVRPKGEKRDFSVVSIQPKSTPDKGIIESDFTGITLTKDIYIAKSKDFKPEFTWRERGRLKRRIKTLFKGENARQTALNAVYALAQNTGYIIPELVWESRDIGEFRMKCDTISKIVGYLSKKIDIFGAVNSIKSEDLFQAEEFEKKYGYFSAKYENGKLTIISPPENVPLAQDMITKDNLLDDWQRKNRDHRINNNFNTPKDKTIAYSAYKKIADYLNSQGKLDYINNVIDVSKLSKAVEFKKDYGDFKVVFNKKTDTESYIDTETIFVEKFNRSDMYKGLDASTAHWIMDQVEQMEIPLVEKQVQVMKTREFDKSYITISPLTRLTDLKLTPVFFMDTDVVNNKEGFEKALAQLRKNEGNIPTIVLNNETEADVREKLKGIDLGGVVFQTQDALGLKDFDLASLKASIEGIDDLMAIPITEALKTKYPPLAHATQG